MSDMTMDDAWGLWNAMVENGTESNICRRYLAGKLTREQDEAVRLIMSPEVVLAVAVRDLTAVIGAKR